MSKLEEARSKLVRTGEQIVKAQEEIESLLGQITDVEDGLTRELSLVDLDDKIVAGLEKEKEDLQSQKSRLSARILALQGTLEAQELDIAQHELGAATREHKKLVEEAKGALATYRIQAIETAHSIVQMSRLLYDKQLAANDCADKVKYYALLLGQEQPKLASPGSMTHEEDVEFATALHGCPPIRPDPWRRSPFAIKTAELSAKRNEKKQAIRAAEAKKEALLAR